LLKYFKRKKYDILSFKKTLLKYFPGNMGISLRRKYLSKKINCGENVNFGLGITVTGENNISFGKNITIMDFSYLYVHNEGHLKIGDNFSMNTNSCLGAADGGEIIIGNNVIIAQNVVLRAADHEFKSVIIPILEQGHIGGKIIIGDDCWIGANAVITRNVTIGSHSIVAAGAVVTKNVEPYSVVAGVPGRVIYNRKNNK